MEAIRSLFKVQDSKSQPSAIKPTESLERDLEAGEGDSILATSAEVTLDFQEYYWREKYRPRKPKYFNYVHTGHGWSKDNRNRYDGENPPPKSVQGYKFNIFYPDLILRTKIPKHSLEKDTESDDGQTCIIRFQAGPPYEDVAFRILNDEWDYSGKRGFKYTFERGILKLHFNFKRCISLSQMMERMYVPHLARSTL